MKRQIKRKCVALDLINGDGNLRPIMDEIDKIGPFDLVNVCEKTMNGVLFVSIWYWEEK